MKSITNKLSKGIRLFDWKKPESMVIKENVCCKCGKVSEQLFHLKDIHGIHGDYCNVCFNNANSDLVKHKHLYPQRYQEHDRQIKPTDRKYIIYESVK